MLTTLLLLAAQPAPPVPPAPPAPEKEVVREIVIRDGGEAKVIRLPEGEGERHRIVIMRDSGGKEAGKAGEKRELRVIRGHGSAADRLALHGKCEGGQKFETEAEGGKDGEKNRTRILLCTKEAKGGVAHADALERAAKRIADDKAMPEEVRARVLASLNAEIARLKAGK